MDEAKSNAALRIAVGMGIPFRFMLGLCLLPLGLILVVFFAIVAPHSDEAGSALSDFPDYWHWIWHGEKKW